MSFINYNQDFLEKHQASGLAYELRDTIAVAYCALDNDHGGIPLDRRGINSTLERAERMASQLIDKCELLERSQNSRQAE